MAINKTVTLNIPAGEYILGDPCCVFNDNYMNVIIGHIHNEDLNLYIRNKECWIFSVLGGDGILEDSDSWTYFIDTGIFGLISLESIPDLDFIESNKALPIRFVNLTEPTNLTYDDTTAELTLGDIKITLKQPWYDTMTTAFNMANQ